MKARTFHAYCVGTSKSGTHSVADIFGRHYRAAHEPEYEQLIEMLVRTASGVVSRTELTDFIHSRDRKIGLELECSHPLFHVLDVLVDEFKEAKFILTIRDCYSWLDSQINTQLSYIETKPWQDFGRLKFSGETGCHPGDEQLLAHFGLYTLDGYLAAWAMHNQKVLTTVPPERLLVLRTQDIAKQLADIAAFLGVPLPTLDPTHTHSFKGGKKFDLLSKLDEQYLEDKVATHCHPLMNRYFPDLNLGRWQATRKQRAAKAATQVGFASDNG